ncbi:hypothetical protein SO802_001233 [Lithocarpus litseifolius]|uniref:Aminotransferase-like plant mobile domain-containing protein n=1 Tax=Lithocarpus litseifolius TaxID=425828 RepID=A0AAW2DVI8_9ROSI
MLTPYDFSVITGLRLGGKRLLINDSFTSTKLKKLLDVMPSRIRSNNVPLSWLCESILQCETVAKGARMFMLLFIRTFLCLDLGGTMNLHYLGSLRKIEHIHNYDQGSMAYATLMHFMTQLSRRSLSSLDGAPFVWQVWVYEYFGVGPEFREEVADIFLRFLRWFPKHRLSILPRRSLEIWRSVIDNLTIDDMNLNPWVGCKGYVECERALESNSHQVLFECGYGKYWYLGERVLPQVEHVYRPTTIPTPPCHTVWLANFLADEEITRARDGYIVIRVKGNYSEFIRNHLQCCLVSRMPSSSEGEEEEDEEINSLYDAGSSSSSFAETYPHFPAWQYDVMNPDGTYSSMPLTRSQHVPNIPWPDPAHRMETAALPGELWMKGSRALNLKIISTIPTFLQVKKEILKVAPLEVDQKDPPAGGLRVLMMHDFLLIFPAKQKEVFLRQSCIIFHV